MEKFNNMEQNKSISIAAEKKEKDVNRFSILIEDAIEMAVKSGATLRVNEEIRQAWLELSASGMRAGEIDSLIKAGLERKFGGHPVSMQKAISGWDLIRHELRILTKEELPSDEYIPDIGVRTDAGKWIENVLMSFEDYIRTLVPVERIESNSDFKAQVDKLQSYFNGHSQGGTKLEDFKGIFIKVLDEYLDKSVIYKNNPKLRDQAKVIVEKALQKLKA